jgi:hypothetical protein
MMLKRFAIILLVPFVVACAQASAINVQDPSTPPPTNTPLHAVLPGTVAGPTSEPGVVSLSGEQTQAAQANHGSMDSSSASEGPAPAIEWNSNPTTVLISATNCCGLVTPFYRNNYIPDALVWGDGRILWTQRDANGNRQVLQGQLSPTQLHDWLQNAADAGFFGWKALYKGDNSPTDLPTRCISISLSSQDKKVCEYFQGAPEAYEKLYDQLSQGLGAAGTPFVPQSAYLTAHSFPKPNLGNEGASQTGKSPSWNATAAGVSLAKAGNGVWLEGDALKQAWELVNQNPIAPMAMEDGQSYQLTLQIPGISLDTPPAQ